MQNSILDASWYAWTYRENGLNLIRDANMAALGVAAWPQWNASDRTKVVDSLGTWLRIAYNGTANPSAYQGGLTASVGARIRLIARGDGAGTYPAVSTGAIQWNGLTSTGEQIVDITVTTASVNFILYAIGTGYADFRLVDVQTTTAQAYNQSKGPLILPANLIEDASMLAENTYAWFANNAAVLSKQPGFSGGQTGRGQCLRVAKGAGNNPWAQQRSKCVVGVPVVLDAWARSDGSKIPQIIDGTAGMWTGTASTSPQKALVAATPANTSFGLYQADTVGGYTEWQDTNMFRLSDYLLGPITFVGCTTAGAIEGKTIVRVAKVVGGDEIDIAVWNTSPGASAVIPLTSPWLYACNSGSRTTQTSDSTLVLNIAAHQAPWRSVGVSAGLSLEPRRTNLMGVGIGSWALTSVARTAATGPSGALDAFRLTDSDNVNLGFASQALTGANTGANYSSSCWLADSGGGDATQSTVNANLGGAGFNFAVNWPITTWARRDQGANAPASASTFSLVPANVAARTGYCSFYGVQFEQGLYPTSVILPTGSATTRNEAYLLCQRDVLNLSGEHYPVIEFAPHYASTEAGLNDVILDDPQVGRVFYRAVDRKFVARLYGYRGECVSDACTFSRNQVLRIQVSPNLSAGTLTLDVLGCTGGAGDGSYFTRIETTGQRYVRQGDGVTTTTFPAVIPEHGISFDGGDYVVTDITDPFEWNGPLTILCAWTGIITSAAEFPLVSTLDIAQSRGVELFYQNGRLLFYQANSISGARYMLTYGSLNAMRGPRVHAVAASGTGTAAGVTLYENGQILSPTVNSDTLGSNTVFTGKPVIIGARWNGAAVSNPLASGCRIYQVKVIPKALGPSDIKALSSVMMNMLQV